MARYDASINLLVTGQQKVERLLSSVDRLQGVIDSLKSTPIDLNINNFNKKLAQGQKNILGIDQKINRLYNDRIATIEKIGKLSDRISQKDKILQTSAESTKKYQEAARIRKNALEEQVKLQDELNESIRQSNKLSEVRAGLVDDQASIRALRQQIGFAKTLANSYLEFGDARKYAEGKGFAQRGELVRNETSIAQIKQQAASFELLANNTRIASREFNRFTVAAQLASQKAGAAQIEQLSVLAEAFSPAGQRGIKPRFKEAEIAGARGTVGGMVASYSQIAKSEAALSSYSEQLRSLQALVPYTSNEFRVLEEVIARVNEEIAGIGLRGQKQAVQTLAGPATDLGTLKAFQQRESFQKKVNDELAKQAGIEDRISRANISETQSLQLRNRLEEAATALAENRLEDARRISIEIDKQRMSMERANKSKTQVFGALGTGFMPITGKLPGGELVPGSPAAKLAEAKANRESTQAAVALAQQKLKALEDEANELRKGTKAATALGKQKLKALEDEASRLRQETSSAVSLAKQKMREEERAIAQAWKMRGGPALPPGLAEATGGRQASGQVYRTGEISPIGGRRRFESTLASGLIIEQSLINLQNKGADVANELLALQNALNNAKREDFNISLKNLDTLSDQVALAGKFAQLQRTILAGQPGTVSGFPSSPVRGGVNMPGSPIFKETPFLERQFGRRGGAAISEGLIGGAFPLLFGQGIGAAIGGGAGGVAGGLAGGGLGFGLSLAGTALGTAFDTLNQAAQETGRSLKYPVEGFEKLKEAGLFATRQQEYYISKLIESGKLSEAAGEIQAEIIKKIGVRGVKDLTALGDSSSKLSKIWAEFNLQLQAGLAGPMAGLLNWLANVIDVGNSVGREAARQQNILSGLSPENKKKLLAEQAKLQAGANLFNEPQVNKQISQLYTRFAPMADQGAPSSRLTPEELDAQKKAQGVTKELQAQAELQAKQLSLTGLTLERDGARYVNAVKAVALQEYENKLLEIKNSWIGKTLDKEQYIAQIRSADLELATRLKQVNQEIALRQEDLYKNSLQAQAAIYQEEQKTSDLIIETARVREGEAAALKMRLSIAQDIRQQKLNEFYVESKLVMIEARKNGTAMQTAVVLANRLRTLQSQLDLEEEIARQQAAQLQFNRFISLEEARRQGADPFRQFRQSQELNNEFARTYFNLLRSGIAPAEAERIANFERLVSEQLISLDTQIASAKTALETAINYGLAADEVTRLRDNLEQLQESRGAAQAQRDLGPGPAQFKIPGAEIQEFISQASDELNNLESVAVRVSQGIGDAIGNSMSNGIMGLIEGTATAQQIFADFLKQVGQILAQEGARMIATYIAIGIAKIFAGLASAASASSATGPNPGGIPSTGNVTAPSINGFDVGSLANVAANGAYFSNGLAHFANGGTFTNSIVSSPTLFKFADGGAIRNGLMGEAGPEAIMPLKRGPDGSLGVKADLGGAMQRYRSQPVVSNSISGEPGGSNGAGDQERQAVTAGPIDVRFNVERINSVDYVTADQFQAGIRQAAQQGATQGEQRTLRRLQQSRSTRSRLGMA